MHWLNNFFLLQVQDSLTGSSSGTFVDHSIFLKGLVACAPILSFLVSIVNIVYIIYVFKFTKRKNDTDRNIKWFQELVYAPNKENISAYFATLHSIKVKVAAKPDLTEDDKISLMTLIKEERNKFLIDFVDLIKPISKSMHSEILKAIDGLTDELTTVFDNDELKWNNPKTQHRELTTRINNYRNKIFSSLFNYKG